MNAALSPTPSSSPVVPSALPDTAHSLLAFLIELGAARTKHSARTLLEHLVGTAVILARWGAPERVWKAGLFHSVYGTEFFHDVLLDVSQRPRVIAQIGDEAEELAHVFCAFDRRSLYRTVEPGAPLAVRLMTGETRELKQVPYTKLTPAARERSRSALAKVAAILPAIARGELDVAYAEPKSETRVLRAVASAPKPGLRALLDTDRVDEILKNYPDEPFIVRGPVERLAGLVDYELEELAKMKRNFTKAFFRTVDGTPSSIPVSAGQERQLYDAGFTIYFHSLRAPKIDEWLRAIDEELGLVPGATRVSAFASRRGLGLRPHYDPNDNFVCQARGIKRWRVAPNTHVKYPTVGYTAGATMGPKHRAEAPGGLPAELPDDHTTIEMRPGMVCFMPRGIWHDTETLEEASLHFNIQSGLATWKDAVEYALQEATALHAEELRCPVRELFDGGVLRADVAAEIKAKLHRTIERICDGSLRFDKEGFERFVAKRRSA
jgi:50S ribosomal protein L16 3-hydroxylase